MPIISDYTNFDYQTDFWGDGSRIYEDTCEKRSIEKLLSTIPKQETLLDAGSGFGRLFPAYEKHASNFILLDYAKHLLAEAKKNIKTEKQIQFIQGSFYKIPLEKQSITSVISIRTLHHINEPKLFFKEVFNVLKPGGYFIFEIPNKRHIKNILKFITGNLSENPFSLPPLKYNDTFINYHPKHITILLQKQGFTIKKSINTSFFRLPLLKKYIPVKILCYLDNIAQKYLSRFNLMPSIFILAKKHDNL